MKKTNDNDSDTGNRNNYECNNNDKVIYKNIHRRILNECILNPSWKILTKNQLYNTNMLIKLKYIVKTS